MRIMRKYKITTVFLEKTVLGWNWQDFVEHLFIIFGFCVVTESHLDPR